MTAKSLPDTVLLISDLHLDPERPGLTRAFFDFLEKAARGTLERTVRGALDNSPSHASALYILGDFFNVWVGDDDDSPLCADVARALKRLADAGTAVYLMHGNRDFLMGERWAAACGATLIHEPYVLHNGDAQFLLMHGDALCTRDTDYMAFRTMVRDPAWQQAFLARPLAERRAFAEQARARSKTMSSNKPDDIMDVTPSEVEHVLDESGVATLIHGHTHRPAVHDLTGTRRRIVLGDWDAQGWYLRIADGEASLESFRIA
ncbi:MAG: UDP-2,3-diacylglucosamine diphosphatase [Pseudomonadota bacterium]|nr:UDP-2,3-diacylglucosamine diphosphatase [Pseudomonadota bacterium]